MWTVTRTVAGLRSDSSSSSVAGETFGTSAAREKRFTLPIPPPDAAGSAGTPVPNAPGRANTVLVRRPVALNAPAGPLMRTYPSGAFVIGTRFVSPAASTIAAPDPAGVDLPLATARRRAGGRLVPTVTEMADADPFAIHASKVEGGASVSTGRGRKRLAEGTGAREKSMTVQASRVDSSMTVANPVRRAAPVLVFEMRAERAPVGTVSARLTSPNGGSDPERLGATGAPAPLKKSMVYAAA